MLEQGEQGEEGAEDRLRAYEVRTGEELEAAARLVGALYASMADFRRFTSLSLLYFAAASFTESARRLGRPRLAGSFLMNDHPGFGPRLRACCEEASRGGELAERVHEAIEPIDVAGLGDRERRNWYPATAEDLVRAAGKLDAAPAEIRELLVRSGFLPREAEVMPHCDAV
jgi:FADH2 O2-dependent halogenase